MIAITMIALLRTIIQNQAYRNAQEKIIVVRMIAKTTTTIPLF